MRKTLSVLLVFVLMFSVLTACKDKKEDETKDGHAYGKTIYVSPNGNDENDGSKDSPLATLSGAIEVMRQFRSENGLPEGGIKIEFAEGIYNVFEGNVLLPEDSGEKDKPIVFAAADSAEVIFEGGFILNPSDFVPADDDFKSKLQTEEAKNNVVCIDLEAAGVYDIDDSREYAKGCTTGNGSYEITQCRQMLYVNNRMQRVAKWPNGDDTEKVAGKLAEAYNGEYTAFSISEDKAVLWANEPQLSFNGNPYYDFRQVFEWHPVIDTENLLIKIAWNYGNGDKYYIFNAACELDEPGEYYWCVESKKLYYWPTEGFSTAKVAFSQFIDGDFLSLSGVSNITIDGFTFENFRTRAFFGEEINDVTIKNCNFYCMGPQCINFTGNNIVIDHNVIEESAGNFLCIYGGDSYNLINSGIEITNNRFSRFCDYYMVGNAGMYVKGHGFYIAHNQFDDSFAGGMCEHTSNTILEYNTFTNLNHLENDCGAIYNGDCWNRKSIYRYNYFENCGSNGIYLDDMLADMVCYGNILVNIKGNGFALGGGRYLTIFSNVLVNTGGIGLDERGADWYPTVTSYPEGNLWGGQEANVIENYLTDLWRYAIPNILPTLEMRTTEEMKELRGIVSEILDSPGSPAYADIYGNIGYNNGGSSVLGSTNYIFNRNRYMALNNSEDGSSPNSPKIVNSAYSFGKISDNIEYIEDQINDVFADPENGNFFLKEDSRVYREIIGFEKWDYSLLGVQ